MYGHHARTPNPLSFADALIDVALVWCMYQKVAAETSGHGSCVEEHS